MKEEERDNVPLSKETSIIKQPMILSTTTISSSYVLEQWREFFSMKKKQMFCVCE